MTTAVKEAEQLLSEVKQGKVIKFVVVALVDVGEGQIVMDTRSSGNVGNLEMLGLMNYLLWSHFNLMSINWTQQHPLPPSPNRTGKPDFKIVDSE